jgi:hypothetical protein
MQLLVKLYDSSTAVVSVDDRATVDELVSCISSRTQVPESCMRLMAGRHPLECGNSLSSYDTISSGSCISMLLRIRGGIDFQHREGSKFGGGGIMSESQVRGLCLNFCYCPPCLFPRRLN